MGYEEDGKGKDKSSYDSSRYNAIQHGLFFSGIMRCEVCKLKDCPLRMAGAYCAKELVEMRELDEMSLDDLRMKIVTHFGKLLVMLMVRLQVQSGFGTVNPQTFLKVLEMAAKFTTSSKGRIRMKGKGLAELLIEEKSEEKSGGTEEPQ